jgi:hypothetical protein
MSNFDMATQSARAEDGGISRYQQHKLDKLARLRPDLKRRVAQGELSVHRAALLAGFVKAYTPRN